MGEGRHAAVLRFYRDLIALRQREPSLSNCSKELARVACDEERRWLVVERGDSRGTGSLLVCNLSEREQEIELPGAFDAGWTLALWAGDARYGGEGELTRPHPRLGGAAKGALRLSAWGVALYVKEASAVSPNEQH